MKVVTRFAPSPTGYLHIGGARTAIFNYLFAKKNNGKYLVRIEDTDLKRSTNEAVKAIHDGLDWLKINSSEKIVYQSKRIHSHIRVAYQLLEKGFAYKCYLNSEELDELKIKSRKIGYPIKSPWREKYNQDQSQKYVVRLKMPSKGITTINDLVQGEVTVQNKILDDMIILRSDKTPTYMLSSVVDDYEMGITHIIRGDDHFNNAFRQIQIINFLKWSKPCYAHIPLIHGTDGTKLSKRHGATNVFDYHKMGYTSEAMFSYLLQLGWSSNNESEYNHDNASKVFSLKKVNKSPAMFDMKKLNNINSKYLKNMSLEKVYKLIINFFNLKLDINQEKRFKSLLPELLKRINLFIDVKDDIEWIINDSFVCSEKDIVLRLKNENSLLKDLSCLLNKCKWTKDDIENCLKQYMVEKSLKFKDIGPILRIALTGKTNSPDIVSIIYELGCAITLNRLNYNY